MKISLKYETLDEIVDALDTGIPLSYILERSSISDNDRIYITKNWDEYIRLSIEETGGMPPQRTMNILDEDLFKI